MQDSLTPIFVSTPSSIVYEVIGTILFFYEEILHAKKVLKKHISKYKLTKHSNKKLLIYILCFLCFFKKIYMQTYEEKSA